MAKQTLDTTQTAQQADEALLLAEDYVGPSLPMEIALRAIVAVLLTVSMLSVARVFGYDTNYPLWSPINLRSGSIAVAIDGIFFLALYLARGFWTKKHPTPASFSWGLTWFIGSVMLGLFSWFSNSLYFSDTITVSQTMLNNAGFGWLSRAEVVQGLGLLTPLIVLWYSFVPRRQKAKTIEQQRAELQYRKGLLELHKEEQELVALRANTTINVARGVINKAFNLDERKARKDAEVKAAAEIERQQADQKAHQKKMWSMATPEMREAATHEGELESWTDYEQLEQMLLAAGMMPFQQTIDTASQAAAKKQDAAPSDSPKKPYPVKKYYTAAELAAITGKSERSIRERSAATYKGHNPIRAATKKQGSRGERLYTDTVLQRLLKEKDSNPDMTAVSQQSDSGSLGAIDGVAPSAQAAEAPADETPTRQHRRAAKTTVLPSAEAVNE